MEKLKSLIKDKLNIQRILNVFCTKEITHDQLMFRRRIEITVIMAVTVLILCFGAVWMHTIRSSEGMRWIRQSKTDSVDFAQKDDHQSEVSDEVKAYKTTIEKYAKQYGIEAYVPVIEAVMQQESAGVGNDVMKASECYLNTRYAQSPDSIEDPVYSIEVGVHYFAVCLELSECVSMADLGRLKLALQGYNFGEYYIEWAKEKDGAYTTKNAQEFSILMTGNTGWASYGDPDYVAHVFRFIR